LRRSRFALGVLAALCSLAAVLPVGAQARTHHVSIIAVPNPIDAGDPMVIVGHVSGPANANRRVNLFHRLPNQFRFSFVQSVQTDSHGNYLIPRGPGVVDTNRTWFVRSLGAESRRVHEGVHALVTLNASTTQAKSNQPVVFAGHVTPNHRGDRVFLQRQVGDSGDNWQTIDSGRVGPASNYAIVHRFRVPTGDALTLRVAIRRDRRNLAGASKSVDVDVEQNQNPKFTLNASQDPIPVGQSVTLSGTLAAPDNASQMVVLWAHEHNQGYHPVAMATTDASGNYAFPAQSPLHTTVYQARSANGNRRSAQVFEAVRDVIGTVSIDPSNPTVGQVVSVKGTVAPPKVGHFIELEKLGRDGDYHTIQVVRVNGSSQFEFLLRFSVPGTKRLRVHIDGGPFNWGANSDPVNVSVSSGAAPTSGGPPASS
jgi:hypothetical protein